MNTPAGHRPRLGVIYGNRDFFPDHLISEARQDITRLFEDLGIDQICVTEEETALGGVGSYAEAQVCGERLRQQTERLDGILVCLPNFGDEKAVADAIRISGLRVPVLVQAYPDDLDKLTPDCRRDAFCGKMSVCNNLRQYGIRYSLTSQHTVYPDSPEFRQDLKRFLGVCRVVGRLRQCRIGAIGARPDAFNTVRFSEKILEAHGISTITVDWSELLAQMAEFDSNAIEVKAFRERMADYVDVSGAQREKLDTQARLGVVVERWRKENGIDATAIQCWTGLQQNVGVNVCTLMAMMGSDLMPSACEVDVAGAITMYVLALASLRPSLLVDWNNNYGDDSDRCVVFHCGNWPAECYQRKPVMSTAPILETVIGQGSTCGALSGRLQSGPVTFGRLSSDDLTGKVRGFFGEGRFTDDTLNTFGSAGVLEVPRLHSLLRYICREGFEHHAAMNQAAVQDIVSEALGDYLGWDIHLHDGAGVGDKWGC